MSWGVHTSSQKYIYAQLPSTKPLFKKMLYEYEVLARSSRATSGPEALGYLLVGTSIVVAHARAGAVTYTCIDSKTPTSEQTALRAMLAAEHNIAQPRDAPRLVEGRMTWIADSAGSNMLVESNMLMPP